MSWLRKRPDEDSFVKPKTARGGTFLKPDITRQDAIERIHGETQLRDALHHLKHQLETQQLTHELAIATNTAAITTVKAAEQFAKLALEKKMDVATFSVTRQAEEKSRIKVDEEQKTTQIKLNDHQERERIRLENYKEEAEFDMLMAAGLNLNAIRKLMVVGRQITRLKELNADPEEIETLRKIRDQMA